MLLLVDAGNTRIKWALADAGPATPLAKWKSAGSVVHGQIGSLAASWAALDASRVLLSNVAGAAVHASLDSMLTARGLKPEWQTSQAKLAGIRNGYRQPAQLGSDRFYSSIGAHALYPDMALMVVTCGTATTIDAITEDGTFRGGLILPGLGLMAGALARNTAQLPQVEAHGEDVLFADNTEEAIIAGCMAAQAGAIERVWAGFLREYGECEALCLVSGGAGAAVAAHLAIPHRVVDNLVLPGLQAAAYMTTPP
ncbi:MAG TPA: type III pantothenate kinase [Burkholderiaceae bacterium]